MEKIKIKDVESRIKCMEVYGAIDYLNNLKNNYSVNVDRLLEKYEKKKIKKEKEILRIKEMLKYENDINKLGYKLICGIDEAGRGPLAGPVVSSAVILNYGDIIEGINDSKKLSAKKREELYDVIKNRAVSYGIGIIDEKRIDSINILNATKLSMKSAIDNLGVSPDYLLIDNEKLDLDIAQKGIPKGDSLSLSIAAASIIAKVTRDRIMEEYDNIYPEYGFKKNKGYGTRDHIEAIKNFGYCPIHRMSFIKKFI